SSRGARGLAAAGGRFARSPRCLSAPSAPRETDLQARAARRWHAGHGRAPKVCRTVANILSDFFASPLVSAAVFALGVGAIGLWLAAAWWTYTDAGRRTESSVLAALAAGWIVVSTPFLLPLSLAIYRAARPQVAAADARAERLAINLSEEAVAASCPQCASRIEPGWLRCPRCTAWLAAPCRACGQWTDPTFDICPLCGSEEH